MARRRNSNEYQDGTVIAIADFGLEANAIESLYQLRKSSFSLGLVWLFVSGLSAVMQVWLFLPVVAKR